MPIAQQQKLALSQAHGPVVLLIHFHKMHYTPPAYPGHAHWFCIEMILQ